MAKSLKKTREEARRLYLTGEMSSNAEIAAHLKVKPHTIGNWRRVEDWDGLRRKIDLRAAEMFVEKIATDRVALNTQHYQLWGHVVSRLIGALKGAPDDKTIRLLDRAAGILDRAQKGQRLARGLSTDGQTEEATRAEAETEIRDLIDRFIDAVKEHVPDEPTREQIRQAIFRTVPDAPGERAGEPGDAGHV